MPRFNHSTSHYNEYIIIYGGEQQHKKPNQSEEDKKKPLTKPIGVRIMMNDLWIFNIITMEWEQITQSGMYFIRKRHATSIVSNFMLMYGGVDEHGKGITDIFALNLNDFKWLPCPVAEGEGPGPLTHLTMTTVIHPDRANKKQFSLFKNPAEMKYKANSKLKLEGVFVFGGRKPNGFASNQLWVL